MASIPKIFHSLEKKEMTLSEYEKYMNEHTGLESEDDDFDW